MTYTTYDDVLSRWVGNVFPADETLVTTLIGDAEDTILREFPSVPTRIAANELPVERVKKVVARMVERKLRNPTGQRSVSQGAGPFQQSTTFGGDDPGTMYLTDADRYELAATNSNSGKVRSVDITPLSAYQPQQPDIWWPI